MSELSDPYGDSLECLPFGEVDGFDKAHRPTFRLDHEELDPKEQSTHYYEVQDALRGIGLELIEPQLEHDCLTGILVPVGQQP